MSELKKEELNQISFEDEIKKIFERSNNKPEIIQQIEKEIERDRASKFLGRIRDKERLADEFIRIIPLYYDESKNFWLWDSYELYWKKRDEIDVLNWINGTADVDVINGKERQEILTALKLKARLKKPIDLPEYNVQFKDEIINIVSGDRFKASPKYFCTNPIPYKLGKSDKTPTIDKLFRQWVTNKDEVELLYEFIAFTILPTYLFERVVVLHGSGSNGKGIYKQIVRKFIGLNNTCSTSFELLCKSRFEVAKLHRKLLCEIGETNIGNMDNTDIFKRLVSGKDFVGAEEKGKTPFDFINYAKILISTNNLPSTEDKTDGFYRRFCIVDFPNTFEKEVDILPTIPEEEFENLGYKCIELAYRLMRERIFTGEGDIKKRKERYEHRSNPIDKFFNEFVDEGDVNSYIQKWEFEKRLNEWLSENRIRAMSDRTISKVMKNKGIEEVRPYVEWYENDMRKNRQVRSWGGIKWR